MAEKKTPKSTPKTQGASAKGGGKKSQGISATQGGSATGVKKRERKDCQVHTEPGDNAHYIGHTMRLANLPKVDTSDAVAVENRVNEYFGICAEEDIKPSVIGLAVSMGICRQELWNLRVGAKGKNPAVVDTLKKAMDFLELQQINYMQDGKMNPIPAIFLLKNNFAYADEQKVTIQAESPLGDIQNDAELQKKYLEDIVAEGHTVDVTDP